MVAATLAATMFAATLATRASIPTVETRASIPTVEIAPNVHLPWQGHVITLATCAKAARLRHALPGGAAAGAEELARVVAEMSETLGAEHQQTRKYADALAAMRA